MKPLFTSIMALVFSIAAGTAAAEDFNIVGFKLGMTYKQAKQALLDYNIPSDKITEKQQYFTYYDGLNTQKTPPFLYQLWGSIDVHEAGGWSQDRITLYFSPPPQPARVVGIKRSVEKQNNPPTKGQYMEATKKKFGEPQTSTGRLVWWFPEGKINCFPGVNLIEPESGDDLMKQIFMRNKQGYLLDRFRSNKVSSIDDCASYLVYNLGMLQPDDPAKRVSANLTDVTAWLKATIQSMEWVDQLAREATEARIKGSGTPAI